MKLNVTKLKENVGKASTKTNITSQLQDYNQLNTAMQALRNSVNDVNNVKANNNYINEDNGPKSLQSSRYSCSNIDKCTI